MFNIYIGLRGSGKTSHASYIAHKYIKKGIKVYSNVPISGTYQYQVEQLGKVDISNGVLIYDEAGIDMSNRSFASKGSVVNSKEFRSFWKLSRHYKLTDIYVYSQAWDFDAGVRRLADRMYIVTQGILPHFSHLKPVKPSWDTDDDGQPVIKWKIGGLPIPFFRYPYYRYYNSYEHDALPCGQFPIIPYTMRSSKYGEYIVNFKRYIHNNRVRKDKGGHKLSLVCKKIYTAVAKKSKRNP